MTDLETFFKEIGEIQYISSNKNKTIVIYYRFYDALVSIEFFKNQNNFKENISKETFTIDWLDINDSIKDDFSNEIHEKVVKIYNNVNIFYQDYFNKLISMYQSNSNLNSLALNNSSYNNLGVQNNQYSFNNYNNYGNMNMNNMGNIGNNLNNQNFYQNQYQNNSSMNLGMNNQGSNINSNIGQQNFYNNYNQNTSNSNQIINQSQNQNQSSFKNTKNVDNDFNSNLGKFTCKYEIMMENDKDFQIARKLIGAKGCNMKRIVESCGYGDYNDYNDVKLRLRGQGSGFKEGPYNKESDEPLHLCVSSKYLDKYQYACELVEELLESVYEDYKKYCYRNGVNTLGKIYRKIEEGITSKKGFNNNTYGGNYMNNFTYDDNDLH